MIKLPEIKNFKIPGDELKIPDDDYKPKWYEKIRWFIEDVPSKLRNIKESIRNHIILILSCCLKCTKKRLNTGVKIHII